VKKEGYILIVSLWIVLVLFIILTTINLAIFRQRRQVDYSYHREKAFALAESGVEAALCCLNEKNLKEPYPAVSGTIPDAGRFLAEIISLEDSTLAISSTGYSLGKGRIMAKKRLKVTLKQESPFDMAIFAASDKGTGIRVASHGRVHGDMGTNSTSISPPAVILGSHSEIDGKVYVGEGATPDECIQVGPGISPPVPLSEALTEKRELPDVIRPSIPAYLHEEGDKTYQDEVQISYPSSFSSLTVKSGGKLTFSDGADFAYVKGDLFLTSHGQMVIDTDMVLFVEGDICLTAHGKIILRPGKKLTVYAGGNINIQAHGIVNEGGNASHLVIFGLEGCKSILLTAHSDFFGTVYAKYAGVNLKAHSNIYGSIVADKIITEGQGALFYDERLLDPDNFYIPPPSEGDFIISCWKEGD